MFGLFKKNKETENIGSTPEEGLELEFRRKDGSYLFSMVGGFAKRTYLKLNDDPCLIKTSKNLKPMAEAIEGVDYVVFECVNRVGWRFFESIEVTLMPGDYIKIIQE